MARGSAAWMVAILVPVSFIVGALLLTVTDPVMQNLFASTLFTSSTQEGTNTLKWLQDAWEFWPVSILIGLTITVWISTRQET